AGRSPSSARGPSRSPARRNAPNSWPNAPSPWRRCSPTAGGWKRPSRPIASSTHSRRARASFCPYILAPRPRHRHGRRLRQSMGKRIAIVGTGAVGGYAGAHMARAGEDVTFLDPWPEHVEAMRQRGLRVTHARDVPEFSVGVKALHLTDAQRLAKEAPIDI